MIKFIFYKPRKTLYEVLFQCKIKDQVNDAWIDGLVYRETGKPDGQVYTRPLTAFSDNFELYES